MTDSDDRNGKASGNQTVDRRRILLGGTTIALTIAAFLIQFAAVAIAVT